MLNKDLLNISLLGLVIGMVVDIDRLATDEGLIRLVFECLID